MNKFFQKIFMRNQIDENLINEFINKQEIAEKLPELSNIEKTKFEHDVAIDHLYYSSKIEGVDLKNNRLFNATK